MKKTHVLVASALAAVLLPELGFRLFEGRLGLSERVADEKAFLLDGRMREYEPNAHTVFQHPHGKAPFNSLGFRGPEWKLEKTPGVPRILCLGSSTTEAFGPDSYPLVLEGLLERATGHDFEVLVGAIAGWTTAEEVVSWFLRLQDYHPDLLLFHCAINDLGPRFRADFEPDYSHWRRPLAGGTTAPFARLMAHWSDLYVHLSALETQDIGKLSTTRAGESDPLVREGRFTHETSLAYRRNVRSIAVSAHEQGATVALMTMPVLRNYSGPGGACWEYGVAEHNQHLRDLCAEEGYLLIDCERVFAERPELQAEFVDLCHLKPPGNQAKAEAAAKVLLEGWVAKLPPDALRAPPGASASRD